MILSLKKELPKGEAKSCREYEFDSKPNSKQYETGLERKNKKGETLLNNTLLIGKMIKVREPV